MDTPALVAHFNSFSASDEDDARLLNPLFTSNMYQILDIKRNFICCGEQRSYLHFDDE